MKNWPHLLLMGVLLIALVFTGCGTNQTSIQPVQPLELNVSAAVSLKDALVEIREKYQTQNPNIKIVYNLGASGTLQKQIEQGAPTDIFISAAPKQMDELAAKNLVNNATRKNLVENKLVIIVPLSSKLELAKFVDLTKASVQKISIGEPTTVPAGQYAQEVLKKIGVWDEVKDKTVLAKDVRTVLTYVETGNVEAGIVYKTDAVASDKVKLVAIAPVGMHQPIVYPVAVLTETKQPQAAQGFITYITGPESKAIFEKYGFTAVGAGN